MGTKIYPGKFDCYAAAKPDEPMFILLARDDLAPVLVRLWAAAKCGDSIGMVFAMNTLANEVGQREIDGKTLAPAKAAEAFACSDAMEAWKLARPDV